MAYRFEQNEETGKPELVIDGFEKGIADSPYQGIGNLRNLNIKYYQGVAYMNYKRQAATILNANGASTATFTVTLASPAVFTSNSHNLEVSDQITFTTTGALPTGISTGVTYYVISVTTNTFTISATRGGGAINTSGSQSGVHTFRVIIGNPKYATKTPSGIIFISDSNYRIWKQTALNGSTFQRLSGNIDAPIDGIEYWNGYLFSMSGDLNGSIEICGDGVNDAGINSGNWNNTATSTIFTVTLASPGVFTTSSAHGLSVGDNVRLTTTGALPTGLAVNTNYYVVSGGLTATTFEVSGTPGGSAINTSGSQSGIQQFKVARGLWPMNNSNAITFTAVPAQGATSGTISSVGDASGIDRPLWNGPTGVYHLNVTLANGTTQVVLASLTQNSNAVSWTPALNFAANSSILSVSFNGNGATDTNVAHPSLVAANTGDLYFCNHASVAAFTLNPNQTFNKNDFSTFEFNVAALSLPAAETSVWLMELRDQLIVSGLFNLYPWDFFSIAWQTPVPILEKMSKGINILNNLYIFAGNKGNIYQSNGYSIDLYRKLPDNVAGVIDPSWYIGGIMQHRQKLVFQATAYNGQTGVAILQGIFSLDLGSGVMATYQNDGALTMEGQNSGGLNPAGIVSGGVLIDNTITSVNYDKYYSAFGANVSGIDFNDTTLYSNNEAVIETDIIPIGTFADKHTLSDMEFKLDQPLKSGDSITVYMRQSLADSYTQVGSTTLAQLSDLFDQMPLENMEWLQIMLTLSCNPTATASSFIRLREIRVRPK